MNIKRILILLGTLLLAGIVTVAFTACTTPETPRRPRPQ